MCFCSIIAKCVLRSKSVKNIHPTQYLCMHPAALVFILILSQGCAFLSAWGVRNRVTLGVIMAAQTHKTYKRHMSACRQMSEFCPAQIFVPPKDKEKIWGDLSWIYLPSAVSSHLHHHLLGWVKKQATEVLVEWNNPQSQISKIREDSTATPINTIRRAMDIWAALQCTEYWIAQNK